MPEPKLSELLTRSKEILSRYRRNAIERKNKKAKGEVETVMTCLGRLWGMACDDKENDVETRKG